MPRPCLLAVRRQPPDAAGASVLPLEQGCDALPDADAHRHQAKVGLTPLHLVEQRGGQRAPVHPSGCPRAIAPPFTFTRAGSSSSSRMQASDWAANASFSSTRSTSSMESPVRSRRLPRGGYGTNPHVQRIDADHCRLHVMRQRRRPELLRFLAAHQQQGGRSVVQAGGVAGRHRAALAEGRGEFGKLFHRGIWPWMLVHLEDRRFAAPLRTLTGTARRGSGRRGSRARLLLAAEGELILVLAPDAVTLGDVFCRLPHADGVLLQPRVHQPPAEGGAFELLIVPRVGLLRFGITYGARVMLSTPPAMNTSPAPVRID